MATKKTTAAAEEVIEATAETADAASEEVTKEIVPYSKEWYNEKVSVTLFKDGDKYKDDLIVGVNGEMIKIPRGVPCMVKRKHALLIDQSLIQDLSAAELMKSLAASAQKAESEI